MLNKSTRVKKTIINRRDGNGKKNILTALGFLSPTLVIFCAFVLFPVFFSFYLSFHKWNMFSSGREFLGLENYRRLFSDPEFWMVLKNTFIYTLGTVPLNMVIALLTAIILNRRIAGKRFLRTAIFTPVVISPVAAALIWRWIYDPNFGLLNYLMDLVGLPSVNWLNEPKAAMVALIIMGVWKTFGTNMVLFSAGLQGIPDHYYEAAEIDGAGWWSKFWNITMPMLSPTTFFIMIMSMISSFQVFDIVYVLTSGGPLGATKVMVFYIYENAFKFFEMGYASAAAYVFFAILAVLTVLQVKFMQTRAGYEAV
ncbi:MAG: sugar ABC transporter permease [Candidatus Marinimicrobia bacterium]|nr:sugar ABC transporter permease [Candidatus Neomarinimicrobiota bacterium]HOD37214.1 sugar ABC transporter permease [Candidatus Neomarinimicrobiota bacterium]HOV23252.1 sugar ABC transporter permease [Candidatus Neomarinimicrobiota bacterium]HPN74308.1 sugar ABC transporter permease [Candidatus Neomarinimicrobiota bacterium]HQM35714.1 sugar ABC transporter permease [Candidatus Neomarinimicrobiota bacterium]